MSLCMRRLTFPLCTWFSVMHLCPVFVFFPYLNQTEPDSYEQHPVNTVTKIKGKKRNGKKLDESNVWLNTSLARANLPS